jgi:hypothetical protein
MDTKQVCSALDKQGLKMGKDKILELVKKSLDKDFVVMKDNSTSYMIIKVKSQ